MNLTYFKRYRMEIDLFGRDLSRPAVPDGYRLIEWDDSLLDTHAEVKFLSFRDEIDANVFPCFNELSGCRRLMNDIAGKPGFVPEATWLAIACCGDSESEEYCGTVQGIRSHAGMGAVQNLGITPLHRSRRLGTALLFRSLEGFRQAGLNRVYLEVTADNEGAIRLYQRLGFKVVKTVFKASEVAYS